MLIRLGSTIAIGISTAVYSSVQAAQSDDDDDEVKPYRMALFVSVGLACLSCLFVPFLRIGTQGNAPVEKEETTTPPTGLVTPNSETEVEEKPAWEDNEKGSVNAGTIKE